jgi:hypothetical protein
MSAAIRAQARQNPGEPPRSAGRSGGVGAGSRADEIEAEIAGLDGLATDALRIAWQRLHRATPPTRLSRDLLIRGIAYKVQERAHGGLSPTTARRMHSLVGALGKGDLAPMPAPALKPGARLVREWRGRAHAVIVRDDGFDYDGGHYRSLSEIARQITGSHRSGPMFFGLKQRPSRIAVEPGNE